MDEDKLRKIAKTSFVKMLVVKILKMLKILNVYISTSNLFDLTELETSENVTQEENADVKSKCIPKYFELEPIFIKLFLTVLKFLMKLIN